jgi:hypothetical protein
MNVGHVYDAGRRVALPVIYAADGAALIVLVGDPADKQWRRTFRPDTAAP